MPHELCIPHWPLTVIRPLQLESVIIEVADRFIADTAVDPFRRGAQTSLVLYRSAQPGHRQEGAVEGPEARKQCGATQRADRMAMWPSADRLLAPAVLAHHERKNPEHHHRWSDNAMCAALPESVKAAVVRSAPVAHPQS